MSLWALPPGVPLAGVDLQTWPKEYIQAAGSRDRLIVEIRRIIDGVPTQYAIGRTSHDDPGAATETVAWSEYQYLVPPNEVFDGAEATTLFLAYFHTGDIPTGHTLRTLKL